MVSRRHFLAAGGAALASAAGLGLYAWQVEPHWLEIVPRSMHLPNLPRSLERRTLLQLSDLHVGPRVDPAYLEHALRRAAALAPDFVVVTGDFISYRSPDEYRVLERVLAQLPRGRLGTLAALGNHDFGPAWRHVAIADRVSRNVSDAGARVLRNESCVIAGIQFAGLGDYWSPEFGAPRPLRGLLSAPPSPPRAPESAFAAATLATLDGTKPTVVLCHNPDALDEPIWGDLAAWVLAGHTHGGQCKPPFLPPPLLPVRNRRYTAGAFDVGPRRTLYINRGVGHLIQVRFNVRPEITLFTLKSTVA